MKFFLTGLMLLSLTTIFAQNTYHRIIQLNNGQKWLRSAAAQVAAPGTSLFLYGHGGATIGTSGASTGVVTNLNGAGHYDLNRVERVSGDTLFLALPVMHSYNSLHSQLVMFEGSPSVTVTGSQRVSRAFNGTLGGIIFIAAEDKITLAGGASLDASGAGFRGGATSVAASDCNRFTIANGLAYGPGNWRGSSRGEGIGGVPSSQPLGRAPAGNGGGGGNDHNAGGGGGANTAGGGVGARNIVMGLFNNACRGNFPGLGGTGQEAEADRVYFGGGGGAGHANNFNSSGGGNGGGLIVLWAPTIDFGNSSEIIANGADGSIADGDGGGGGGAAGSVLLTADTLIGSPSITLDGGQGGDVTNITGGDRARCIGPGGGGAGGRLLNTATNRNAYTPDVSLAGGTFGKRLGSTGCSPNDEPAGIGEDGTEEDISIFIPFGGFVQSADTLCGGEVLRLVDASSEEARIEWSVTPQNEGLQATQLGKDLRVTTSPNTSGTFRAIQTLFLDNEEFPGDTAVFTVTPSPTLDFIAVVYNQGTVFLSIMGGTGFDFIRYDFGDGTVIDTISTSLNHAYTEAGDFTTSVTLINDRCGDEIFLDTTFVVSEFASVDTDLKFVEGCAPYTFTISDRSSGTFNDRRWNFPGGSPEVSSLASPTVTYTEAGEYDITLTLLEGVGADTIRTIPVRIYTQPVADVSFTVDTASAAFINETNVGTNYFWEFGDDSTSTLEEPTHTYLETGTYTVNYLVENGPCRDSTTFEVTIDVLSDVVDLEELGVRLFPNPTSGQLTLTGPARISGVFDLTGRQVLAGSDRNMDLSGLPASTYMVSVLAADKVYWVRIVKR